MNSKSGFTPLWLFVLAFVLTLFATHGHASGGHDDCHHDCGGDTQTINKTYNHNSGTSTLEAVGYSVAFICLGIPIVDAYVWPFVRGVFTLSRPKYRKFKSACQPDRKPEPMPDPGPVVKSEGAYPEYIQVIK